MLKYEANVKPGAVMMQASGTLETVTGEATYLIHKLYCDLSADKEAAQNFKRMVQAVIGSETSPVWEVDE